MAYRAELEDDLAALALDEDATSWSTHIERAGQSPNYRVTIENSNGFKRVFTVKDSGESNAILLQQWHHDTIAEVRRRRGK